ncbi:MAG: homoserine dehydrogenase [Verrucomicrobiota bacterium]|nr:homoserine dehydrogenase [Verrucomicrobiota bacterium]
MREIGVGLLGFGTIGAGVVAGLRKNGDLIAERVKARLVLRGIADIDLDRDRGVAADPALLTRDAAGVIRDPAIDIIVELIGGARIAGDFIRQSLEAGKPVVTANKALLAEQGEEIFGLAERANTDLYFEGSVGGTIPVIKAIREGLVANRIEAITGILNGTCNYILTRMDRQGMPFDAALQDAQARGYAEAEPSLDVDGRDTAHKAVLLASLACGSVVPMSAASIEGIRAITQEDIRNALEIEHRIKLLAFIAPRDREMEVRVHPTLVPLSSLLASVHDVFNAVQVKGDLSGETLYYGCGAGRDPTAGAVIADVVDIARNIVAGCHRRVPAVSVKPRDMTFLRIEETDNRYYVRVPLASGRNLAQKVRALLAARGVPVASVERKRGGGAAEPSAIAITETVKEKTLNAALAELSARDWVRAPVARIRFQT